jgi:hypothetical protein
MKPAPSLIGQTFGRLTVIAHDGVRPLKQGPKRYTFWRCVCSCGTTKAVSGKHLLAGGYISCGCAKIERLRSPENRKRQSNSARLQFNSDDPKMIEFRRIKARLHESARSAINRVKKAGGIKSDRTINYIGCTVSELKAHIEAQFKPGMTWENHGKEWHIDHIMPLAKFDLTNQDHIRLAMRYTNLQPLWADDNLAKSDAIIDHQALLI